MTRAEKPLLRTVAVLLAATTVYGAARWRSPRRAIPRSLDLMRDAVSAAPDDLAGKHARLAAEPSAACALCHVPHKDAALAQVWRVYESAGELRAQAPGLGMPSTAVCLACHDSFMAGKYAQDGSSLENHPIGIDYRAVWLAHPEAFQAPDGNAAIRLEDGKVGCVSCHQLHGRSGPVGRAGVIERSCQICHKR